MKKTLFLSLLVYGLQAFDQSGFAQTQSILSQAKQKAEADYQTADAAFQNEIKKKGADYKVCNRIAYEIQREYAKWFLDHYASFEKDAQIVDEVISTANQKLKKLHTLELTLNPVQTQSEGPKVLLSDLIAYFNLYNGRMKDKTPAEIKLLSDEMKSPEYNPLKINRDQVDQAIQLLTTQANASLKSDYGGYDIEVRSKENSYEVVLKVLININSTGATSSGPPIVYEFSLLDETRNTLRISVADETKWKSISQAKGTIDGQIVDASSRYRTLRDKLGKDCSNLARIKPNSNGIPYEAIAEVLLTPEPKTVAQTPVNETKESARSQRPSVPTNMASPLTATYAIVEPGSFQMGSPGSENGRDYSEGNRKVAITRSYEIQTTEVTQQQWVAVMGSNPSLFSKRRDCKDDFVESPVKMCRNLPVDSVSYDDVQGFLQRMNQTQNEYVYALPTEAQWEYAARGAQYTAKQPGTYFFGDDTNDVLKRYAWFAKNSRERPHAVAQKEPNALGLYDVYGNVAEWTADGWTYLGDAPATDPTPPTSYYTYDIVTKGGGWGNAWHKVRSASRRGINKSRRKETVGLRLVRTLKPENKQ